MADRSVSPPDARPAAGRSVVGIAAAVAILAGLLIAAGLVLGSAGRTVGAPSGADAVPGARSAGRYVDRAGRSIDPVALDEFEAACRSMGLDGGEPFCRCAAAHLPSWVDHDEIRPDTMAILAARKPPARVRAVMAACAANPYD